MIKRIIIGCLSAIGLFYIAISLYVFVFSDCRSVLKEEINSPDGKYKAEYVQETCKSEPPRISVWVGEHNKSNAMLVFSSIATTTTDLQLTWVRENALHIIYPRALEPTTVNVNHNDVFITYERNDKSRT